MIRKMTSLSAAHVGLSDRGLVKPGYIADLVLFDPLTITDRASIENPKELSEGIVGVWVNGERVWNDRNVTDARPGILVRPALQGSSGTSSPIYTLLLSKKQSDDTRLAVMRLTPNCQL